MAVGAAAAAATAHRASAGYAIHRLFMASDRFFTASEGQLHRQLYVARRAADRRDPAEVTVARRSVAIRISRIDDVERIEELAAHLQRELLLQRNVLEQRHVRGVEVRVSDQPAARGTERHHRNRKRRGVEPTLPRTDGPAPVAYHVLPRITCHQLTDV